MTLFDFFEECLVCRHSHLAATSHRPVTLRYFHFNSQRSQLAFQLRYALITNRVYAHRRRCFNIAGAIVDKCHLIRLALQYIQRELVDLRAGLAQSHIA